MKNEAHRHAEISRSDPRAIPLRCEFVRVLWGTGQGKPGTGDIQDNESQTAQCPQKSKDGPSLPKITPLACQPTGQPRPPCSGRGKSRSGGHPIITSFGKAFFRPAFPLPVTLVFLRSSLWSCLSPGEK